MAHRNKVGEFSAKTTSIINVIFYSVASLHRVMSACYVNTDVIYISGGNKATACTYRLEHLVSQHS